MDTLNEAWQPLPTEAWDRAAARHLALRLGYSQHPQIVDPILQAGPAATVRAALTGGRPFVPPDSLQALAARQPQRYREMRQAGEKERREMRQQWQRENREGLVDYALAWYAQAADPANSAREKLVGFFQNIWVVSIQGVQDTAALYEHQKLIRAGLVGTYPEMCRQLSLSPAMVRYLNLQQNKKDAPNENFARELFELFTLGQGNYTEQDIKECARALTGYQFDREAQVRFLPRRHDGGSKTIFGHEGRFQLDDVLRLVFAQPAAHRFLPRELCRYYLTDNELPEETIEALGQDWRAHDFSLPHLLQTFFSARLFYDPAHRGRMIKSPEQFVIGFLQDLELGVPPVQRALAAPLRRMGQPFFQPPNVRGWVGGKYWINSATLQARRQFVELLLFPPKRDLLNADERMALEKAESEKGVRLAIDDPWLRTWLGTDATEAARRLSERLLASGHSTFLEQLLPAIEPAKASAGRARAWLLAACCTPEYHLC